ncbi:acyl-CoA dehydrogenase C-terminal domain-containing protein [Minwuia sp.]|uniref:acyl-CoA dehydrogenase C-terminal domain-containing protein n=1 Tax=Minwuia sp. TaxID=2493630 RepID=UPI003A8CA09F
MPTYQAPVNDFKFLLHDFIDLQRFSNLPGFEEATPDLVDAILEEGAKFFEEQLQPLNVVGDREGCTRHEDGSVTTPTGFKEAYQAYVEGGWGSLTADPEYGGQGLPHVVGFALSEMASSANMAFAMYPGLTHGCYEALHQWGTDEQKQAYLPKLITGEWTGTMNLTEPHCGTDLGLMRTKAEPQDDGSYAISGQKIFISAGEHDMSENIIHLVLAKIPGGPDGIKGVSLFIVPKFLLDENGDPGERNGVVCGSIEEKMGIHGNATCVLNYDNAKGFLIGDKHKGMRAMFTMMNAARLGVGIQGLSQASVAYQNAVTYANDRLQGRSLTGTKEVDKPADPLMVHPDIRRMLMKQKAFVEGSRALALYTGLMIDFAEKHPDPDERQKADDYAAFITPVVKAYLTDMGFECTVDAMQVYGGHGFITEWGMEQFVRDARITQIYEGANGIQALDLVGRKLPEGMGRLMRRFFHPVDAFIKDNAGDSEMADFVMPLAKAFARLQSVTADLGQKMMKNPDEAGAASTDYLRMVALVALGHMWGQIALKANAKLAEGGDVNRAFYENKLATARFYMARILPDVHAHAAKAASGADNLMSVDAAVFEVA